MTDIVERLRRWGPGDGVGEWMNEAAAEIETWRQIAAQREERLSMAAEIMRKRTDEIERCYRAIADLQAEVRRKSEEIERMQLSLDSRQTDINLLKQMARSS